MFARTLCAFCLLASPAAAELITISEGHHARVNLNPDRELLFTGGTIEYLNNVGGVATIDGGVLTGTPRDSLSRVMRGGTVCFRGSGTSQNQNLESRADWAELTNVTIIEGAYFRARGDGGAPSSGSVGIEGVMLDGSFLRLGLLRIGDRRFHRLEFITHPELVTDPTGDGLFNLEDLNIVRNNFGAQADRGGGDIDGDGVVGLGDLNQVRDHFSTATYSEFMGPEYEFSGEWDFFTGNPVPEPSSIALGLLLLTTALPRIAYMSWCSRGC